jgi:hypothetical protein
MDTRMRETISILWRRRNSCDPRLRRIARELLRQDLAALRQLCRSSP